VETRIWLGIALAFWLWGLLSRLTGTAIGVRSLQVPKWLAMLLLSRSQQIPAPSAFLQTMGLMMAIYAVAVSPLITNELLAIVLGLVLPALGTRIFLDHLTLR
jgi:hypothetical protein